MKSTTRVVVIGDGIAGCSALYHLTREGWSDVVLIEHDELTSGTTWHSAAQVTNFGMNQTMVGLKSHSIALYSEFGTEPDYPINYHHADGGIRLANTEAQMEGYRHFASMARGMGVDFEVIDAAECARRHPLISTDNLIGGLWDPLDGDIDPAQLRQKCPQDRGRDLPLRAGDWADAAQGRQLDGSYQKGRYRRRNRGQCRRLQGKRDRRDDGGSSSGDVHGASVFRHRTDCAGISSLAAFKRHGFGKGDAVFSFLPDSVFLHDRRELRAFQKGLQPAMQMQPWLGIEPDGVGDAKLPDKGQGGEIEEAVLLAREARPDGEPGVEFGQHGRAARPMFQRRFRIKAAGIFIAIQMGFEGAVQRVEKRRRMVRVAALHIQPAIRIILRQGPLHHVPAFLEHRAVGKLDNRNGAFR